RLIQVSEALRIWREKLVYLQEQEAIASDAAQKFTIKEQIEEAEVRIKQLSGQSDDERVEQRIAPTRLHHGADHLFGRDEELAGLDQIANDPAKKILTIVAFGGVGKTSLVIEWMARQAAKNWEGFERVFDWSFFSQGTREQGAASAESFVAEALRFFGDEAMAQSAASPWDKG